MAATEHHRVAGPATRLPPVFPLPFQQCCCSCLCRLALDSDGARWESLSVSKRVGLVFVLHKRQNVGAGGSTQRLGCRLGVCVWEPQFHSQYCRLPLSHRWGRASQNYSFVFWVFFIGFGATSSGTQGFLLALRSGITPGRPRDPMGYRGSNPGHPPTRQTPSPLCHHSCPQNDSFIGDRQRRAVAIHVFLRPSTVSSHQLPLRFLPSAAYSRCFQCFLFSSYLKRPLIY